MENTDTDTENIVPVDASLLVANCTCADCQKISLLWDIKVELSDINRNIQLLYAIIASSAELPS